MAVFSSVAEAAALHHSRIRDLLCLPSPIYRDKQHPIYNFLFTYFHFNEKRLYGYSPGVGIPFSKEYAQNSGLIKHSVEMTADGQFMVAIEPAQFPVEKISAMRTTLTLLRNCYTKQPAYSCFGLHEWAMLYRPSHAATATGGMDISAISSTSSSGDSTTSTNNTNRSHRHSDCRNTHQALPLRLTQAEINRVVERGQLRCTHFDATRFFAAEALPLNRTLPPPSRANQPTSEQPGCVHVTMDLFKWAIKVHPFLQSDTVADSLELALFAREVDMRASPYDLTAYQRESGGLGGDFCSEPIRIETTEGRAEYARHQVELHTRSQPIRLRLIDCYESILHALSEKKIVPVP